ncbi:unnamed protein product [Rotaria socialis]|uniref:Uncharacterized protein n=1 Tax=Rotaria socialis TaxID=392032 RepID=A0A818YVT5_9BILA|nr:unnamed protein product [Rotaria socialis]
MFIESRYIRGIGDDIQIGELVLQKNVRLGSTELGLLATVGLQIIHVFEKPRVVILSTDSNKIILMSALKYTTCYLLSLWHYIQQVTLTRIPYCFKQLFREFSLVKHRLFKHYNLIIQ